MRSVRRFLDIWMIQYAIKLIMILKIVKKNDDDNDDNGHLVEKDRGVWPSGNKENIDKETSSLLLLELQSQMGNLLGSFEYKI